ncbi:MAG: hypothetical protein M1837_000753 [Sclerophora amabilis]|nr:MAG: hypothetical protein M1837_000753 [Sclerophora amabilis]
MPSRTKRKVREETEDAEEDLTTDLPSDDINPYEVLDVPKSATAGEIKKAYRKKALQNHPDKAAPSEKSTAHTTFQKIALAYAVLSSPDRRKYYDTTGSTSETLSTSADFSWREYYAAQYADNISAETLSSFKSTYQGSDEERGDVLAAYEEHEGNMDAIFETVMCSEVLEDEDRFRTVIDAAIKTGEVESHEAYVKEGKQGRKRRVETAKREAAEAVEMAREMGIEDRLWEDAPEKSKTGSKKTGGKKSKSKEEADPEAGLRALILQRSQGRAESLIDQLESKYAPKPRAKGKGNAKASSTGQKRRLDDVLDDEGVDARGREPGRREPPEEAFAAMADRGEQAKREHAAAAAGTRGGKKAKRTGKAK